MKKTISAGVLFFIFTVASFAADYPKATGHMNDIARRLPEFMVENLEIFTASYSRNQHLDLVILVMDPPEEVACATAKTEPYAKKVLDSWNEDGVNGTNRGTILFIVYTGGYVPQIEASVSLQNLVTDDLQKRFRSAVAESVQGNDLPQIIVRGVNSFADVFMDKSSGLNQVQARR